MFMIIGKNVSANLRRHLHERKRRKQLNLITPLQLPKLPSKLPSFEGGARGG